MAKRTSSAKEGKARESRKSRSIEPRAPTPPARPLTWPNPCGYAIGTPPPAPTSRLASAVRADAVRVDAVRIDALGTAVAAAPAVDETPPGTAEGFSISLDETIARLSSALAPVADPIQVAIGATLRLAHERANETHAQRDIDVALLLEAVSHIRSGGKRDAGIVNAANKYLQRVPHGERVWYDRPVEMKSAAAWTNELRVYMVEAIEIVSRLRQEEAGGVNIAGKLDWQTDEIMRAVSVVAPVERGDRMRVRAALAAESDPESLLRKVLEAHGLSSGDVNRLTKAAYVKRQRKNVARRKRAAK
jgi:hypothetical protein